MLLIYSLFLIEFMYAWKSLCIDTHGLYYKSRVINTLEFWISVLFYSKFLLLQSVRVSACVQNRRHFQDISLVYREKNCFKHILKVPKT